MAVSYAQITGEHKKPGKFKSAREFRQTSYGTSDSLMAIDATFASGMFVLNDVFMV
jgi:hypothetical protein